MWLFCMGRLGQHPASARCGHWGWEQGPRRETPWCLTGGPQGPPCTDPWRSWEGGGQSLRPSF